MNIGILINGGHLENKSKMAPVVPVIRVSTTLEMIYYKIIDHYAKYEYFLRVRTKSSKYAG